LPTGLHVIGGIAVALAQCAVLQYALGVWLRRGWVAVFIGRLVIALPYAVTTLPPLPDPSPSGCCGSPRSPASPSSRQ
jgi:hypothetical protein